MINGRATVNKKMFKREESWNISIYHCGHHFERKDTKTRANPRTTTELIRQTNKFAKIKFIRPVKF